MMKVNKLLLGMMFCMYSTSVLAMTSVAKEIRDAWGSWPNQACLSEAADNFPTSALIQNSRDVSAVDTGCRQGYGRKLMVALNITDKGAMFCPVFVYGVANGWHGSTYTRYGRFGDNTHCVWLCLPGWTGEKCEESSQNGTTTSMYDMEDFRLDRYLGKYNNLGSAEAEPSMQVFWGASEKGCYGNNSNSENDMILAVTGFLPSGNGAWVQPTAVTAYRYFGWGRNGLSCDCNGSGKREQKRCERHRVRIGVANTNSAGEKMGYKGTLACKIGFKPNTAGDDCVEINAGAFSEAKCKEVSPAFDSKMHKILEYKPKTTSTSAVCTFSCQDAGYALESASSANCIPCPEELRQGISSEGICLKCDNKHLYDSETGTCVELQILKESDLLYGMGKVASKSATPCWMAGDLEDYRKCIFGEASTGAGDSDGDSDADGSGDTEDSDADDK